MIDAMKRATRLYAPDNWTYRTVAPELIEDPERIPIQGMWALEHEYNMETGYYDILTERVLDAWCLYHVRGQWTLVYWGPINQDLDEDDPELEREHEWLVHHMGASAQG